MSNDGDCQVHQREGFFAAADQGAIFYSNGVSGYCAYTDWDDWLNTGGKADLSNVARRQHVPHDINFGICGVAPQPEGFFSKPSAIYYSNGTDAFCHVPTWEDFLNGGGATAKVRSRGGLPQHMRNDGDCARSAPAACAGENGFCSFSGTHTVRYGANGQFATGVFTAGVACNNGVFGDPARGVVKTCAVMP